jgi:cyclophilin family peptidyl-prolyl cis-trans isomerase
VALCRPVVVELLPVEAPLTVAAFLSLVDRRYFDGSTWHRHGRQSVFHCPLPNAIGQGERIATIHR